MLKSIRWFAKLLWNSFRLLRLNNPLILASSTAFFSTFAMSPILVLLVSILGLYFRNDQLKNEIFSKLEGTLGRESTKAIEGIVNNLPVLEQNWFISALGFLFLLFIATTLLQVIRQAINVLWKIRRKQHRRFRIRLLERTKATIFLMIMGALFIISILLDATAALLKDHLGELLPNTHNQLVLGVNLIFSLLVVTTLFTLLFKMLPDGVSQWRVALAGGILTAILFNAGKWLLGKLLVYSVAVDIFGASTSFALIMLFIFYTSFILYFGAAFTYVYGEETNRPISAGKLGDRFKISVVGGVESADGPLTE